MSKPIDEEDEFEEFEQEGMLFMALVFDMKFRLDRSS